MQGGQSDTATDRPFPFVREGGLVSCSRNVFHYLNENRLPESIAGKFESRLGGTKPETNPNTKMIEIQNLFKRFENLNFVLVSGFAFRASNFARGTSSGNVRRNLLLQDTYGTEH
jgi:hypothetical protein